MESYIKQEISCETNHNIPFTAWYFRRETENETQIYGGTEVELANDGNKSKATLLSTSDMWRGMFQCVQFFFFMWLWLEHDQ